MDGYAWFKVGLVCLGVLIALGLWVQHDREVKRGRERIKKMEADEQERLLREAQRPDPFDERRNPAEGKTRGMGNVQSGYTNSLASKLERNAPPPPPPPVRQPLTGSFRTQQRGPDVHHHHYHEPDNTIPYLAAAAVLLSDSNDNCRESYSPPASASYESDRSCSAPDNNDNSGPSGDD